MEYIFQAIPPALVASLMCLSAGLIVFLWVVSSLGAIRDDMAIEQSRKVTCASCGEELSPASNGPCPVCGKTGRHTLIGLNSSIAFKSSLSLEHRHEFYEKNQWVMFIVILVTVISSLIGLFLSGWPGVVVGLFLGFVTYYLGPSAVIKVREITRTHS